MRLPEVEELKHHIECPSPLPLMGYQFPDGNALATFLHHQGHERWIHPLLPEFPITVAGKDGDDAKLYLEKLVKAALKALKAKE